MSNTNILNQIANAQKANTTKVSSNVNIINKDNDLDDKELKDKIVPIKTNASERKLLDRLKDKLSLTSRAAVIRIAIKELAKKNGIV